jgi:lipopolysaccharide export LptBFGC system permease protein LptF
MGNTASNIAPPLSTLPPEILVQQQLANAGIPTDSINKTIQMINNNIMCGPECQKQKEIDELKLKYEQAQSNLNTAPSQYKTAKKNFLVASEGRDKYEEKQRIEYQKEAQTFINSQKKIRDSQTKDINNLNNDYNALIIYSQNMNDLLDVYITKNQRLKKDIDTYDTIVKTSERKTYYKTQSIEWFHIIQKLILYFYYLTIIVFILYVMIYHKEFKSYKLWFLLLLCTLIPYVIYKVYIDNVIGNSIANVINEKHPRYEFKVVEKGE